MNNADMPWESIAQRILVLRGQKVLLDSDLAELYGVDARRLNEQVRRNRLRFPVDFIFELNEDELGILKSHFATSSWGGKRKIPMAFTEHGAIMAATVLRSPRAAEVSVCWQAIRNWRKNWPTWKRRPRICLQGTNPDRFCNTAG